MASTSLLHLAAPIFIVAVFAFLCVTNTVDATPNLSPKSSVIGGGLSVRCVLNDADGNVIAAPADPAPARTFTCTTLHGGYQNEGFIVCSGRFLIDPDAPGNGDGATLSYKFGSTLDGADYLVARITANGFIKVVLSQDESGDNVVTTLIANTAVTGDPAFSGKLVLGSTTGLSSLSCKATVEPFFLDKPAVNCAYGNFGAYSNCTVPCGSGTRTRTRVVTTEGKNGGIACDAALLSESEACNTTPCPINCAYGAFGPFSNCTAECGGGNRTKERVITTEGQFGGTECTEPLSVTETCNSEPCANNCKREVKCFCALKKKFAQQEQSCTPTNRRRRESYMMDWNLDLDLSPERGFN
eukprot:Opistho-2@10963